MRTGMNIIYWISLSALVLFIQACTGPSSNRSNPPVEKQEPEHPEIKPFNGKYEHYPVKGNDTALTYFKKRYTGAQQHLILALNRLDFEHSATVDSLVIPDTVLQDINAYTPFPLQLKVLKDVHKMLVFAYPIQAFAAYENGYLVRWGPSSMGSKTHPTKTGLAFANWKAEEHVSTADDEWLLRWNFNIHNKEGIGWHQYAMPGYPASHSCLRLLENDARWLYDWADEWIIEGNQHILAEGTPVLVFGAYDYDGEKPWFKLLQDPKANQVSEEDLNNQLEPLLQEIREAQQKRAAVDSTKKD